MEFLLTERALSEFNLIFIEYSPETILLIAEAFASKPTFYYDHIHQHSRNFVNNNSKYRNFTTVMTSVSNYLTSTNNIGVLEME